MVILIMGVAGCGKTTVGRALAGALEPPRDALTVDIAGSPDQIVTPIRRALSL